MKTQLCSHISTTPHKVNVGFYGFLQSSVSFYYVTYTYLSIFRSTKIKTQNKYKLSARLIILRLSTPTLTLCKTVSKTLKPTMAFDYKNYINHLAEELIRNFDFASNATTPVLIGTAKEKEVAKKLEMLLPNSVGVGSGCIIDSYGNTSKQMDIIIYEKEFCPVFCINDSPETTYFPCEGVIAAGEIKSRLNTKELINIFEKSKSVKTLKRYSPIEKSGLNGRDYHSYRSYNSNTSFDCAPEQDFNQRNKILDQIFCFALCGNLELKPATLIEKVDEQLKKCSEGNEINLISILKNGIVFYRNKAQNKIVYLKKDADSFYFLNRETENFQFLLSTLNQIFILSGRTVPTKAFNRYLNATNGIVILDGINGINKDI